MQIYYINLARRTDRRAFMEAQFEKLGLAATRIEAVTPADLTDADRDRPPDPASGVPLPEPALCCGLSHLRALAAFIESPARWALILEDDATLSSRLPAFLRAFEFTPPAAMLVRLEAAVNAHLTLWRSDTILHGIRLHRYNGYDIGSAGYLISRAGAQIVLSHADSRRHDIDVAMFSNVTRLSRQLEPLQANPALCIQAGNVAGAAAYAQSDLLGSRGPDRLSVWRRFAKVFDRDVVQAGRKAWHRFVLGATRTKVYFRSE